MSRSQRKTPIFGIARGSEALDKRLWHKRWRARVRDRLAVLPPGDDFLDVPRNAVSDPWSMAKDGKRLVRQESVIANADAALRRLRPGPEREARRLRLIARWKAKWRAGPTALGSARFTSPRRRHPSPAAKHPAQRRSSSAPAVHPAPAPARRRQAT